MCSLSLWLTTTAWTMARLACWRPSKPWTRLALPMQAGAVVSAVWHVHLCTPFWPTSCLEPAPARQACAVLLEDSSACCGGLYTPPHKTASAGLGCIPPAASKLTTACCRAGSGLKADAVKPAIVQHGSLKVAFLSMADHYADWAATDEVPGIWYLDPAAFSAAALSKAVAAAKALADLVVFFIHWGPNWAWRPDRWAVQHAVVL